MIQIIIGIAMFVMFLLGGMRMAGAEGPGDARVLYGVFPPEQIIELPISYTGYVGSIETTVAPKFVAIDPGPIMQPMYGVIINPKPEYLPGRDATELQMPDTETYFTVYDNPASGRGYRGTEGILNGGGVDNSALISTVGEAFTSGHKITVTKSNMRGGKFSLAPRLSGVRVDKRPIKRIFPGPITPIR